MNSTKKILLVSLLFPVLFSLAACQPTPDTEAVVPKGEGSKMEAALNEPCTQAAQKLIVPETWDMDVKAAENTRISYRSEINIPKVELYPIREVTPAKFSQEFVDQFVAYFAGDKKLYEWAAEATKEDLEQELVEYLKGVEVDGEIIQPEPDDPYIIELKEKIKNFSGSKERIPATTRLHPGEIAEEELNLIVEWSDNEDAMLTVENFGSGGYHSVVVFQRGGNLFDERDASLSQTTLKETSISEREAIAAAEKVLTDLQIEGMALSSVTRAEMQKMGSFAGMYSTYESSGYNLIYTRSCDGISFVDTTTGGVYDIADRSSQEYMPEYSAPWFLEMIMIYVDENGVSRFSWSGYAEIGEKLSENAALLPFEEVMERADKQLFYQNGGEAAMAQEVNIWVDRIQLGWTLINQKDNPGKGLFVPAWHLFYNKTAVYDGEEPLEEGGFLILNAIDGSVVDPLPV